jgi:hypothetical protein
VRIAGSWWGPVPGKIPGGASELYLRPMGKVASLQEAILGIQRGRRLVLAVFQAHRLRQNSTLPI